MNIIDKIFYINLDNRPDRNEHFLKQCSENNIDFNKINRYSALDGTIYNFNHNEYDMFKNVDYKGQKYEKKIMGNQLSHYNILNEMINNNYKYIIIFQDDVILKKNFLNELNNIINYIPENAEIINIGFHEFASYNKFIPWNFNKPNTMIKQKINQEICILENTVNPCSLGYIVTFNGAQNIIEYFKNVGFLRATDWNYNDYLNKKNIFYGSNTVLCTGNPNLGSDIFD